MDTDTTQKTVIATDIATKSIMPMATLLALLSASCCLLPIGLSIIGLGGTWLVFLEPFVAYRGAILFTVALALIWSWYRVLRSKPCERRKTSSTIWTAIATCAFFIGLSSSYWEPAAQRFMFELWRSV